jgi:hypothetical protein
MKECSYIYVCVVTKSGSESRTSNSRVQGYSLSERTSKPLPRAIPTPIVKHNIAFASCTHPTICQVNEILRLQKSNTVQLNAISGPFHESLTNNNAVKDFHPEVGYEVRQEDRSISRAIPKLRALTAFMDDLDSTYKRWAVVLDADKIDYEAQIQEPSGKVVSRAEAAMAEARKAEMPVVDTLHAQRPHVDRSRAETRRTQPLQAEVAEPPQQYTPHNYPLDKNEPEATTSNVTKPKEAKVERNTWFSQLLPDNKLGPDDGMKEVIERLERGLEMQRTPIATTVRIKDMLRYHTTVEDGSDTSSTPY